MDQPTANWEHRLEHAALSDIGLRRANNQDATAVAIAPSREIWQKRGHLFMVADGMGAHAAGELASKLATDTVALTYSKLLDLSPPEAILKATEEANQQIYSRGQADPDFKGMGTTSTTLLLLPQGALVAHVGDSRAYRLRGDRFEQLTFDHSLVWEMRAASQLPAEVVPDYVPKNIITRSLGPGAKVDIDLEGPFPVAVGDTFLLCSDGLSGPVHDDEIGTILGAMSPAEAARALVDLANLRGGPDNVTVIVARVSGPQSAQADGAKSAPSGRSAPARPVHPLVWTLLGVCALAAAGLAGMEDWVAAGVCLIGALAAGVIAMVQRYSGLREGVDFDHRPLGKGPYSSVTCRADGEFVDGLGEIVRQLREAATEEEWTVDWPRFNALLAEASAAQRAGSHPQAVRGYCQVISFMMAQLKLQGNDGVSGESAPRD